MSTHVTAIATLSPNLVVRHLERDVDVVRLECLWTPTGDVCFVTVFQSEPNFLDVERRFTVAAMDDKGELALWRRLDLVRQDFPYIHPSIDRDGQSAEVRIAVAHELPVEEADRRNVAAKCLASLFEAAQQLHTYQEEAA